MATTSPDNIWTPDSGGNYDYVIDSAATASSVQNALTRRANSYTGTTAQRTAFTAEAPEGSLWSDTNGEKILWIKRGATWVQVWPALPEAPTAPAPTGLSTTADWSIVSGFDSHVRIGHLVLVSYRFTYTGSAEINVPTSGDIANQTIGVMPAALRPPLDTPLSSGVAGRSASFVLGANGNLVLAAAGGSPNITTGGQLSCGGTYIAA